MRLALGMPWTTSLLTEVQSAAGIAVIALEGGDGAEFGDLFDGDLFEIHGGCARDDVGRNRIVDLAEGLPEIRIFSISCGVLIMMAIGFLVTRLTSLGEGA